MSDSYAVEQVALDGHTVYVLRDRDSGSEAQILPSLGANCFSCRLGLGGRRLDVLESPPDLKTLAQRPSGFGYPILFPFPNRVRGGRFTFEGRSYQMDVPEPGGNTIHGFVLSRPWTVVRADDADGASLTVEYLSEEHPEVIRQYPFPFRARATYGLRDSALTLNFFGENLGASRMPVGYGVHPYFRAPLVPGGDPAQCRVRVPVRKMWELQDLLPTGRLLPADGDNDLLSGRPLSGRGFDSVFTDVVRDPDGLIRCVLADRTAGVELVVESEGPFREIVVYTPPGRAAICFEPYTCTTDAFNLQGRGVDAGLVVLGPGESLSATVRVIIRELNET